MSRGLGDVYKRPGRVRGAGELVLELARSSGESGAIEESSDCLYESAAGAVPAAASSARAAAAATPIV